MRYQFIADHREQFPVTLMCRVLGVSCSGYYDWCGRPPSRRTVEDLALTTAIQAEFEKSRGTYGSPRILADLRELGHTYGENRVARLMRAAGLKARAARRFKVTTDSNHDLPIAANLLNREFEVEAPNTVWAGDITYVWTAQGWLYLAVVLDLYSRQVVGWSLSHSLQAEIVVNALQMGLKCRAGEDLRGMMFHSDRGSQYASDEFREVAKGNGLTLSMSRRGNCWDNAPSESFFSTLKTELIHRQAYLTTEQARLAIFEYIEVFYNRRRRHSKLGNISPVAYERRYELEQQPPLLAAA